MKKIKEKYILSKNSKVGDGCICPSCNSRFTKTHYAQIFCKSKSGTKCKDKYWNTVDPKKRCNTTRISPASAAWSAKQELTYEDGFDPDQEEHPFSSEALGQWQD